MTGLKTKARTALALGLANIARVAVYRLGVRLGLNPVRRLQGAVATGPFFTASELAPKSAAPVMGWEATARLFSHWPFDVTSAPPDWLANPFTRQRMVAPEREWWLIPDFDPTVGDIKAIWELSRMDWVLAFAQRARNGDEDALIRLNHWLADWCMHNPPYRGPNWKCGQEASIRVMHLAMGALILGQTRRPCAGLRALVLLHLRRIAPTVQYAMAQDNNHGTSEAAALFIGGSWLAAQGVSEGEQWQQIGRSWLENRAARLIGGDGSFSQYSLNYHRVMLDTLSMVEVWRRHMALPEFSQHGYQRIRSAGEWLYNMINPLDGDGPNLGANDGARLLQLADTAYRDYRPTVQLTMALFSNQCAYAGSGSWNNACEWLDVTCPRDFAPPPGNLVADDGGFAVLRRGGCMAMLRYPRFRFRPSQSDALHLDFWHGAENVLRDAGTYCYCAEHQWLTYFGGAASHNTIQFDDRDQMPRLSRFLFGDWLKTSYIEPLADLAQRTQFAVGYHDAHQVSHRRRISLADSLLRVEDEVAGFARKAVLRWRVAPGEWRLKERHLTNGTYGLQVRASMPIVRCELVQGWESRHYFEKVPVPVLEIEVHQPGTIISEVSWPL